MKRWLLDSFAFIVFLQFAMAIPAAAQLVINEIDYDQPSTDTAEFIELKNIGSTSVNLGTFTIELVNGVGGGATIYNTIELPNVVLPPGGYYVVCGDAAKVLNCNQVTSPSSNLIQNGSPDAVGLRDGGILMDAVSYEGDTGAPYTEGSGAGLEDSPTEVFLGISRFPDGQDTDQNNLDLSPRCITPGAANSSASNECEDPRLGNILNRIEKLESQMEKLLSHTHHYLTGQGEGHNNTEVNTGEPNLPE